MRPSWEEILEGLTTVANVGFGVTAVFGGRRIDACRKTSLP